jgi:AcrR family transcriptional regulator
MTAEKAPGLRELKKARTRATIQEHALRLFRAQGYSATTVDQIAAAAEISPATFFRYFPTKEDTVLYDQLDPVMSDVFRSQPAELSPTEAVRATMRHALSAIDPAEWERENQRQELVFGTPELRARMMDALFEGIDLLAGLAAERTGRSADDFAVRAWAGAVTGVVMAAVQAGGHRIDDYVELLDQGLARLGEGLPL